MGASLLPAKRMSKRRPCARDQREEEKYANAVPGTPRATTEPISFHPGVDPGAWAIPAGNAITVETAQDASAITIGRT